MTTATSTHLAGTCRATGATVHAVETHRPVEELDGAPELAVCGALVRVGTAPWDAAGADSCPACRR